ncbi:MAG: cation transporter [Bacteroidetes bacterium]|nr:cation transporter [Bacteroidota bacterium]
MTAKLIVCFVVFLGIILPQVENIVETKFYVFGNCAHCKTRIENALKIPEVVSSQWSISTKYVRVVYNPRAISLDSLQKRIAAIGHDTEQHRAPDSVYSSLPKCCKYRRQ